jgi:hypothetical protein
MPVYYDGYETPPVNYTGHVTTLTFSEIGGFWLVLRWLRGTVRITIARYVTDGTADCVVSVRFMLDYGTWGCDVAMCMLFISTALKAICFFVLFCFFYFEKRHYILYAICYI